MPSTATITSFYSFAPGTQIKSAEHNNNYGVFRGHFIPVDPNTATAAVTKTYDLGATDHYWRNVYTGGVVADTVSATTIVGTTITATSLVATTATVTSLVATTLTATSLIATTATVTSLVATTLTVTSLVATTLAAGSAVATTLTVSNIIDLTGGQIKFPATQVPSAVANVLDDYEEGTWTASPTNFTTVGGLTVGTCTYVKIGRMVHVAGSVTYGTSIAGTAGTSYIAGLPFAPANAEANGGYANNGTGAPLGAGAVFPSGNFYAPTFGATASIAFSVTYQV